MANDFKFFLLIFPTGIFTVQWRTTVSVNAS